MTDQTDLTHADDIETQVIAGDADAPVVEPVGDDDDGPAFGFDGDAPVDEDDDADDDADQTVKYRALRAANREKQRENRDMARQIAELKAAQAPKPPTDELGPKPTLEDHGYDEEAKDAAHETWLAKKAEIEGRKSDQQKAQQRAVQQWTEQVQTFAAKAVEAKIPNFTETMEEIASQFGHDVNGQYAKALLIKAGDPRLIAALKSSPAKLAELVALKDDTAGLAIALGELKAKVKPMTGRKIPAPETVARGGAPVAASSDKQLAKLQKEADASGDRTAVIAYKRKLNEK